MPGSSVTHEVLVDPAPPPPPPPNQAPIADFTAPNCTAGADCQFDDLGSHDPDGNVVGWEWDFGDGTAHSQSESPVHIYAEATTYTVTLIVTDNEGASSAPVSRSVIVEAPPVEGSRRLGLRAAPATEATSGERLRPAPEVQLLDARGSNLSLHPGRTCGRASPPVVAEA